MIWSLWLALVDIKESRIFLYSLCNLKVSGESANADFKAGEEFLENR